MGGGGAESITLAQGDVRIPGVPEFFLARVQLDASVLAIGQQIFGLWPKSRAAKP